MRQHMPTHTVSLDCLQGCVLALVLIARIHADIEPATTTFAHLIKTGASPKPDCCSCL